MEVIDPTATQLTVVIRLPSGEQVKFVALAHRSEGPEERKIESDFYEIPPRGVHHELEILSPPVWTHEHSTQMHVHRVEDGRRFLCWASEVPTLNEAELLFEMWCLGTAYSMVTGKDFTGLITGSWAEFGHLMETGYGLTIDATMVTAELVAAPVSVGSA